MDLINPTHKASKSALEDWISSMPDNVITNILNRLPLQDAVRTDILSKSWRFKWTMLSQLTFDDKFYAYLLKKNRENSYVKIISRLLLHLKGVITKFVLYIIEEQGYSIWDEEDITHWILYLSEKGVTDLTIWKFLGHPLKLPTHLFSCLELKSLKLVHCCFDPPSSFHCFPNLLNLKLLLIESKGQIFGDFFTRCPVLEKLNIGFPFSNGMLKLSEIAKLANLKKLSLSMRNLDNMIITSSSSILELVGILPELQELNLDFTMYKFTEIGAKNRSPTTFPSIKNLKLSRIDLDNEIMLSCAFEMIMSFPNLQSLEISQSNSDAEPTPAICSPDVDYNTMGLLQLQSVVFTYSKASENEVCLISYLLACSPSLKKIVIRSHSFLMSDEKLAFARKLLKLHRASPVVDIDLN